MALDLLDRSEAGAPITAAQYNATIAKLEAKLRSIVHLFDYVPAAEHAAIEAGTSTYDATTVFKTALADAAGAVLVLPQGQITVSWATAYTVPDSDLKILGQGAGLTRIVCTGSPALFLNASGQTGRLTLQGFSIDNIDEVVELGATTTHEALTFRDFEATNLGQGLTVEFTGDGQIDDLVLEDVRVWNPTAGRGRQGFIYRGKVLRGVASRVQMYGIERWGFRIGEDRATPAECVGTFSFVDCHFEDFFNPSTGTSNECNAIQVLDMETVLIERCTCHELNNAEAAINASNADCEAFYTKARNTTIRGCTCVNAGVADASITLKDYFDGLGTEGGQVSSALVDGCRIEFNDGRTTAKGIGVHRSYVTVRDCVVSGATVCFEHSWRDPFHHVHWIDCRGNCLSGGVVFHMWWYGDENALIRPQAVDCTGIGIHIETNDVAGSRHPTGVAMTSHDCYVQDAVVRNIAGTSGQGRGIRVELHADGDHERLSIHTREVSGCGEYGVNLDSGGAWTGGTLDLNGFQGNTADFLLTAEPTGHEVRGDAVRELDVSGALTVDTRHRGRLLRYTGAGHTWTINQFGVGSVDVVNDGSGSITISAGTATVSGAGTVAAGNHARLIGFNDGAEVYVAAV